MTVHAKLSASGAHRWLACPGSVSAESKITRTSSAYADEGSKAHELAEIALGTGKSAFEYEGVALPEYNAEPVTREMCGYVQEYVDYVNSIDADQKLFEIQVDFSPWVPDGFGTSDVIAINSKTRTLYVVDLKYGQGVQVYAKNNPQAMLYALGALNDFGDFYDIDKIVMVIVQPRLDHIDEHEIEVAELLKWADWCSERAQIANGENPDRVPGEKQCSFCAVKATCPALAQLTTDVIAAEFDNLDIDTLAAPESLSLERIGEVLKAKKLISSWLSAVEDFAKAALVAGEPVPGFKLVEGRSTRAWADEQEAEVVLKGLLGDDAFEHKLLSVAKAEKILGKKQAAQIADLVVKPAGSPTIAPESDKREAIGATADMFESL